MIAVEDRASVLGEQERLAVHGAIQHVNDGHRILFDAIKDQVVAVNKTANAAHLIRGTSG